MPLGPGKYDTLCTHVREQSGGHSVAIVVLHPTEGGGFSVQCKPEHYKALVGVFRLVADQIESEFNSLVADAAKTPEAS